MKAVAARLGHTSARMVDQVYVGLYEEAAREMAEAIDALARERPGRGRGRDRSGPMRDQSGTRARPGRYGASAGVPKSCPDLGFRPERTTGFEPATPTLARWCSTN
jgi:hypothetical protein